MNEQVEELLANTSAESFTTVARGALDDDSATLVGKPKFAEIKTSHNDKRTIGIVKVSGRASEGTSDNSIGWSSVVKIIDMSVGISGADDARWVSPRIEQLVYETGLFDGENVPFRSARCYLSQSSNDQLIVLWLEDLSDAPQPPWKLESFINAANHLGQFNGELAVRPIELPFEMLKDGFQVRWGFRDYEAIAQQMLEARYSSITQKAYSQAPVEVGIKLAKFVRPVLEKARSLAHSIAFGDSHSRNMFPLGSQTVGIDWASVSSEPTGVDIGVLIGSALSFGVSEAAMIIENEKKVYESYIEGIESTAWTGDLADLRIGFFAQFIGYLSTLATIPIIMEDYRDRRKFIKLRFGVELEELPEQVAPVIATIPGYVEELKQLLG